MRIGIGLNRISYLPEAYAYAAHLGARGWQVELDQLEALDPQADLILRFMGFAPLWQRRRGRAREIFDFNSVSTEPFARLKNRVKRRLGRRPAGRIFSNAFVRDAFGFADRVPHILRDQGVERALFLPPPANPAHDILYVGSTGARGGLPETLLRLAGAGLRLLVVGGVEPDLAGRLRAAGIALTGRVDRAALPALFADARAGLAYMPREYPHMYQTSTKAIEYCAAGLGLVANRLPWIEGFAAARGARPLWLDEIRTAADFHDFRFAPVDVADREWDRLLDASGFEPFLRRALGA